MLRTMRQYILTLRTYAWMIGIGDGRKNQSTWWKDERGLTQAAVSLATDAVVFFRTNPWYGKPASPPKTTTSISQFTPGAFNRGMTKCWGRYVT